ncbi:Sulfotransferase family protein [Fodinibius roseus]|uniref:Sulfotransferase family protein n=1 Tax=Fodinibius roseus TaxID=1194090 RepID=A0A1M5LUK9_9BACT|nr:sulfotransferase [Fodinibius roseus]SHG68590.1 Sulfotransferase family protein [Fodinibius roseus]
MPKLSLFIVGLPRSGTKLLRELLNNHDQIFIPSIEAYFIPHLVQKYEDKLLSLDEVNDVITEIKKSLFFFYYRESFNFGKLVKEETTVKKLIGEIWQKLAMEKENKDIRILGDKTPRNIYHIQFLLNSFPKAKIIHIVRDPRDNVLSAKKTWGKNIFRAAYKWQQGINKVNEVGENRKRLIEISYEDLLRDTEIVLRRLCTFIGINYQEGISKLYRKVEDREGIIDENNYNKYLDEMSADEIKYIEGLTKKGIQKYNYYLNYKDVNFINSPPPMQLHWWKLQDIMSLVRYNIKEHGPLRGIKKILKARKHA